MGVSIDITDRKAAEDAVRVGQARLQAAAELAGLGFYEADYGERTAFFDAGLRDLLGVPPELNGLQPVEFYLKGVHAEDRERFFDLAAPARGRERWSRPPSSFASTTRRAG